MLGDLSKTNKALRANQEIARAAWKKALETGLSSGMPVYYVVQSTGSVTLGGRVWQSVEFLTNSVGYKKLATILGKRVVVAYYRTLPAGGPPGGMKKNWKKDLLVGEAAKRGGPWIADMDYEAEANIEKLRRPALDAMLESIRLIEPKPQP
jgi:hypothetical protein